jgi:hypothetical protein
MEKPEPNEPEPPPPPVLTAAAVTEIFLQCLYLPEEIVDDTPPADAVVVEGLVQRFGFHPGRLAAKRDELIVLLRELDDLFHLSQGGGASFLGLCFDRYGRQWGEHAHAEQLVVLAIATKLGDYCLPREAWPSLPGGAPLLWVSPPALQ